MMLKIGGKKIWYIYLYKISIIVNNQMMPEMICPKCSVEYNNPLEVQ